MVEARPGRRIGSGMVGLLLCTAACSGSDDTPVGPTPEPPDESAGILCTIPLDQVFDGGVGRDGIRSLEDPRMVGVDHPEAAYLLPHDRVIGVELGGQAYAVPHNILWWHEIVNLDAGGRQVAVSFCPLTGSSLAFDRGAVGGARFGVSGLLFRNNLIMFDRDTDSLWPQMMRQAACGESMRTRLPQFAATETTWAGWKALHPEGLVVSSATGFSRNYTRYPYGDYDEIENPETLFPQPPHDQRRDPKERVFGVIQGGDGGTAFPYQILDRAPVRAVPVRAVGGDAVVFWDRTVGGAAAYFRTLDGQTLSFTVSQGRIVDLDTSSAWDLAGRAVEGPLRGARLDPVPDAYTSFWFSWATFQPETAIWFS